MASGPYRKKSAKICAKDKKSEEEPKKDPNDYLYDPKQKGWRGPVLGKTDTLPVTRLLKKQNAELLKQTKESLLHKREKIQRVITPDLEDESDAASVVMDLYDTPGPDIPKPFSAAMKEARVASWNAPSWAEGQPSPQEFEFEKPKSKTQAAGIYSAQTRLAQAEMDIADRDRDIALLREQLLKAQQENYRLIQRLQSCSGVQFDQVQKENRQLKSNVERLARENMKLQGQIRQQGNTTIQKMNFEQYIADRAQTRSRSKSPSNVSRSSFKLDTRILPQVGQTKNPARRGAPSSGHSSKRSSISVII